MRSIAVPLAAAYVCCLAACTSYVTTPSGTRMRKDDYEALQRQRAAEDVHAEQRRREAVEQTRREHEVAFGEKRRSDEEARRTYAERERERRETERTEAAAREERKRQEESEAAAVEQRRADAVAWLRSAVEKAEASDRMFQIAMSTAACRSEADRKRVTDAISRERRYSRAAGVANLHERAALKEALKALDAYRDEAVREIGRVGSKRLPCSGVVAPFVPCVDAVLPADVVQSLAKGTLKGDGGCGEIDPALIAHVALSYVGTYPTPQFDE